MITGTESSAMINRELPGVLPEGTRVRFGVRPEYGDATVRITHVRSARSADWVPVGRVLLVPMVDLCPVDCGHIVPGGELTCK